MLEVAFQDTYGGVYIQSRHDANLFNEAHFEAKTKATQFVVREMLMTCALIVHNAQNQCLEGRVFILARPQHPYRFTTIRHGVSR